MLSNEFNEMALKAAEIHELLAKNKETTSKIQQKMVDLHEGAKKGAQIQLELANKAMEQAKQSAKLASDNTVEVEVKKTVKSKVKL